MKAYLIVNRHVKVNDDQWLEGVFWKKKNAREYARQLIWKTGSLDYKFLYSIVTYTFEQKHFGCVNNITGNKDFVVILHTLIEQLNT